MLRMQETGVSYEYARLSATLSTEDIVLFSSRTLEVVFFLCLTTTHQRMLVMRAVPIADSTPLTTAATATIIRYGVNS